ncbi:hypothetical protein GRI43_05960 [Altererythrobacter luteolus]|uniref:Uncharacterized protein n=1 Tax=Pontixanthobacter luteolus TaxID=295089 RepID=A0A6I4UZ58_9SPHN|nr:hypothetical protein [Pontixanthobacter luteolus]MXP46933.1 hypothetical protein [Pontixanthobacter luteolus]
MDAVISSAILSAILIAIPEPSSVPTEELGELILEERASQPIVSQELRHSQIFRPLTALVLNEQAVRQGASCRRTQWLVRLTPTGNTNETKVWWVDRKKGVRSQSQIALTDPSGECTTEGYIQISDQARADSERVAWGLDRYHAFLNGEETTPYRCVAEEELFLDACSDLEALRSRLSEKTPVYINSYSQHVRIKIDSMSDVEIDFASPHHLTVKLHRPAIF